MKSLILILSLIITTIYASSVKYLKIENIDKRSYTQSSAICFVTNRYFHDTDPKRVKSYIKVFPKTFYKITTNYNEICIKNLKPKTTYEIEIDKNTPLGKLHLDKSYSYKVTTLNYKPTVLFKESGYILPSHKEISIPIESINVKRVLVKLYRINRNNLVNRINSSSLKLSLINWELDDIENISGYLLWEKYLNINSKENSKVVTAIPVGTLLKKRESGVYIIAVKKVNSNGSIERYGVITQWFMVSDIGLFTQLGQDKLHFYI